MPYLAIIAAGLILYVKPAKRDPNAPKPKPDTRPLLVRLRKEPIKGLMIIYNFVQVVLCTWMCVSALQVARAKGYKVICNDFDDTDTEMSLVLWVFYVSKILDFFDTFFIVARGTWSQFSFLHTYHHVTIYLVYWLNANAGYTGDIYFTVVANSFVHMVMYSYYLARIFGFEIKNKHLVTQLQMVQFLAMNAQAIYILYYGCAFPSNITKLYLGYIVSLLFLFANFYVQSFLKGKGKKKKA